MSHTITVTRVIDDPNADTDDPEYTISGECDSACQNYTECMKSWHRHPTTEEYGWREGEWATKRVPEVHTFIDGVWMLPNGCGLTEAFAYDNPEFQMTKLGTFAVDILFEDWWSARLVPLESQIRQPS